MRKQKTHGFRNVVLFLATLFLLVWGIAKVAPFTSRAAAPTTTDGITWQISESITSTVLSGTTYTHESTTYTFPATGAILKLNGGVTLTVDNDLTVNKIDAQVKNNILLVTGTNTLTVTEGGVTGPNDGISVFKISVDSGATINITNKNGHAVDANATDNEIKGTANLTGEGASSAGFYGGSLTVDGGTVNATGSAYGMQVATLTVKGTNSTVVANGTSNAAITATTLTLDAAYGLDGTSGYIDTTSSPNGIKEYVTGNPMKSATIKTVSAPSIAYSSTSVTGTTGEAITKLSPTITDAGGRLFKWTYDTLPAGLAMDPDTGDITGTPTTVGTTDVTITATANTGATATTTVKFTFTAPAKKVTGITVTGNASMKKGETQTLATTITPDDADDKALTWTSSDASVASVDSTGKVTAHKAGEATITATNAASGVKGTIDITVYVPVTNMTVPGAQTIAPGETVSVKPTAYVPATGYTEPELTYESNDTSVATVDASGNVKGVKAGTATITIKTKENTTSGQTAITKTVNVTVNANKVFITTEASLTAPLGTPYELQLEAAGSGTKTFTEKITGKLPPGLSLSAAGKITGTPTTAGTYEFTITASNGSTTHDKDFTFVVTNTKTEAVMDKNLAKDSKISNVEGTNLAALAEKEAQNGKEVRITLSVEAKGSGGTLNADQTKIWTRAKRIYGGLAQSEIGRHFVAIDLTREVRDIGSMGSYTKTDMAQLSEPVEIVLDADLSAQTRAPIVLRFHNNEVKDFEALTARAAAGSYKDGTFWYDSTNKKLYLYTQYFSEYLIAYPIVPTVTVSFSTDGGSAVEPMIVKSGGSISTKPEEPTKSGYTFDGWYTDSALTNEWTTTSTFGSDSTLYAKWVLGASRNQTSRDGLNPTDSPQTSDSMGVLTFAGICTVLAAGLYILYAGLRKKEK